MFFTLRLKMINCHHNDNFSVRVVDPGREPSSIQHHSPDLVSVEIKPQHLATLGRGGEAQVIRRFRQAIDTAGIHYNAVACSQAALKSPSVRTSVVTGTKPECSCICFRHPVETRVIQGDPARRQCHDIICVYVRVPVAPTRARYD